MNPSNKIKHNNYYTTDSCVTFDKKSVSVWDSSQEKKGAQVVGCL